MSSEPQMPGPGDLVAERYRIEAPLSRGGMGTVFVARHVQTNRAFALKLMSSDLTGDEEAEARFMREARVASSLEHPAIIEVYDVGHHQGFPYMVMQLLQGESLGARIKRGRIAPEEALALIAPALEGIAAAHASGVVHRDLKPDNIFLAAQGDRVHTKVLDFGISKLLAADAGQKLTATGVALGTPLYMSPEQVRGERDIDARTDVYSLGVILYEMLSGVPPYRCDSFATLVYRIVTGDVPPLRSIEPSLSPRLEALVQRAMAVEPAERHPDVLTLLDDLRSVIGGAAAVPRPRVSRSDSAAPTPFATEASSPPPPLPRASRAMWLVLGTLVLVAAVALAWSRMSKPQVARDAAPLPAAAKPAPAPPAPATPPVPVAPPQVPAPPPATPLAPVGAVPEASPSPTEPAPVVPAPVAPASPKPPASPEPPRQRATRPAAPTPDRTVAPSAPAAVEPSAPPPPPAPQAPVRVLDDQPRNPFADTP